MAVTALALDAEAVALPELELELEGAAETALVGLALVGAA